MKSFLVVKTSAIGDVIHTFPIIDYLKSRFSNCEIDWVVEKGIASLVRGHPDIDRTIEIDTKLWRKSYLYHKKAMGGVRKTIREKTYDVLFDFQGNTKSAVITSVAKAKKKVGYGWSSLPEKTNFLSTNVHLPIVQEGNIRRRYLQLLEGFFKEEIQCKPRSFELDLTCEEKSKLQHYEQLGFRRPRLMICFGSNWRNKQLPENLLREFLHLIDEKLDPTFFFIYGNEKEKQIADSLEREFSRNSHTLGDFSLALWQRFMGSVDGVIAMDSAALHLCGTTDTPSFSLFGPSSALVYKPLGEKHRAVQGACPYGESFDKRCPQLRTCATGACLRELTATEIFDQFNAFWEQVSQQAILV